MAAKILVVDDDPNVQRLLQYTLKQEGYDVNVVPTGGSLQALQQMAAGNADFAQVNSTGVIQANASELDFGSSYTGATLTRIGDLVPTGPS